MRDALLERFLRYVKIDTQSREEVEDKFPSTEKQKELSKLLVKELRELGLEDAEMDEYGYVMATLPSNLSEGERSKVPAIGFIAHVDTSPEVSGKDVKPIIHRNYRGGDIVLPGAPDQVIKFEENPALKDHIGDDIITSDGTTLLGADDKAGIAEIMTAIEYLLNHPEIKHGDIRIAFTPDEEVGNGTKYFDKEKFGVKYAYTVDGESIGEIENETFNASGAVFTIHGINVHPGYAKNKLVNAVKIASFIVQEIDKYPAPENTEKREGYLHPYVIEGGVEKCMIKVLIRDFETSGMKEKEKILNDIKKDAESKFPGSKVELEIKESYKNMKIKLEEDPRVVEYALEAVKMAGLEPKLQIIRGGTDGAKLCFMGVLTPNIFTGGHNFHSKQEWISLQAMEKAVETIVNLIKIWTEKSK
ncbi:MAG: peptidase T [Candidatus Neomarinimicrobiota bacterium]|nr:peptidase T [Candidatus Neomarinimicrobiota bacterium]RKY46711.1 MAG: peptidase T [Candidatus Neomarinimicrobiota bacterium]